MTDDTGVDLRQPGENGRSADGIPPFGSPAALGAGEAARSRLCWPSMAIRKRRSRTQFSSFGSGRHEQGGPLMLAGHGRELFSTVAGWLSSDSSCRAYWKC